MTEEVSETIKSLVYYLKTANRVRSQCDDKGSPQFNLIYFYEGVALGLKIALMRMDKKVFADVDMDATGKATWLIKYGREVLSSSNTRGSMDADVLE